MTEKNGTDLSLLGQEPTLKCFTEFFYIYLFLTLNNFNWHLLMLKQIEHQLYEGTL